MAMTRSERIAALEKRRDQLNAQMARLRAQESQAERKRRTKNLIETGAVVWKALDTTTDTKEQRTALEQAISEQRDTITRRMNDLLTPQPDPMPMTEWSGFQTETYPQ